MAVFPKAVLFLQLYRAGLQVAWIINIPATILGILIASMRIPALLRELSFCSFVLSFFLQKLNSRLELVR